MKQMAIQYEKHYMNEKCGSYNFWKKRVKVLNLSILRIGCELGFSFFLYCMLTLVFRCDAIRSKTQRQRKGGVDLILILTWRPSLRIDEQIIDSWLQDHGVYK